MEDLQGNPENPIPFHLHNGIDSPNISRDNFQNIGWQYNAKEYDNGSVSGTSTINWAISNVQYITLLGATTLTFINPFPGIRCMLHVRGAFVPTWPGSTILKWMNNVTPTPTATANHKDIYSFTYSGVDGFWDGVQSNNFATT